MILLGCGIVIRPKDQHIIQEPHQVILTCVRIILRLEIFMIYVCDCLYCWNTHIVGILSSFLCQM